MTCYLFSGYTHYPRGPNDFVGAYADRNLAAKAAIELDRDWYAVLERGQWVVIEGTWFNRDERELK